MTAEGCGRPDSYGVIVPITGKSLRVKLKLSKLLISDLVSGTKAPFEGSDKANNDRNELEPEQGN